MHTLVCFFYVRQLLYAIGLLKIFLGFPHWLAWLTLPMILGQWYVVSATFISYADENAFSLACNQYILFFVHRDAFPGDD